MNIDPVLLAQNFAAIIGLLCNFRQERHTETNSNHQDFIEWLQHHRHEEIRNLIANNHQLAREVDELLRKDQRVILQQIQQLNETLAAVLSRINDFAGLATTLAPGLQISDQAKTFLTKFSSSDFRHIVFWPRLGTIKLADSFNDFGELLEPPEPRFVEDDLQTLTRFGFLEGGVKGDCMLFQLTRAGASYAQISQ